MKCISKLNLLLTISLTLLLASGCVKNSSTISGTIAGVDTTTSISLLRQDFDKTSPIKKVVVNEKKSSFKFKIKDISEPTFFQLHIGNDKKEIIVLLIDMSEKVIVNINLNNIQEYDVEGSEGSLLSKQLAQKISQTVKSLDSLNTQFAKATSAAHQQQILELYQIVVEEQREFSINFMRQNSQSTANVMALYQQYAKDQFVFDRAEDIRYFRAVATTLLNQNPNSQYGKGLERDIKNMNRIVANQRVQAMIDNAESTLPEIALPNPQGDTIRLSSLQGKVILLDFWGSFNQNSLLENRELVEIYRKYRARGFEIYQVSLDSDRDSWIGAIEHSNLPWINVSALSLELPTASRNYNVTGIPANYLISRNYEIVGKNLYGKDLAKQIEKHL